MPKARRDGARHEYAARCLDESRRKIGTWMKAHRAQSGKEVLCLERELRSGSYRPDRYTVIEVFDPKHRVVSAAHLLLAPSR